MRHTSAFLLLVSLVCVQVSQGSQELQQAQDVELARNIARKLKDLWSWVQLQAASKDTFVGRCAGAFKKMRMAFTFIIFKLGVIVTTLAFLSVLAFKSLGLGVLILIVSTLGLFSKFHSFKHPDHGNPYGGVHLHLYKASHSFEPPSYHNSGWDRVAPSNYMEKMAITDMYKRLRLPDNAISNEINLDDLR